MVIPNVLKLLNDPHEADSEKLSGKRRYFLLGNILWIVGDWIANVQVNILDEHNMFKHHVGTNTGADKILDGLATSGN